MSFRFSLRCLGLLVSLTLTIAIAGCATQNIGYVQPTNLTPKSGATILGSQDADPNPLRPDTHVFLMEVDNQPVASGWGGWNQPILVTPGNHLLTFGPCQCGAWAPNGPIGSVTLAENFQAGETYVLRSSLPKGGAFFQPELASEWIQDGTGAAITPPTTVQLQTHSNAVFIPIIVPVK